VNELALFAGAGGGILGGKLLGWRTVCAVEWEEYCIEVLLQRQRDGMLPVFPIWDDIQTFDGKPWREKVDVVSAGFPCQPFSIANQTNGGCKGDMDERNMWPDTIRVIREVQPGWVLLENVPNLLTHRYYGTILRDLAESGYDARWKVLSAAESGAPHKRDRIWVVAHAGGQRETGPSKGIRPEEAGREGVQRQDWPTLLNTCEVGDPGGRPDCYNKSPLRRADDGMAHAVDRLKAIGNGQVPIVAASAWNILTKGI
jgi:DNA (cytosine-5)-methyltransferase 1